MIIYNFEQRIFYSTKINDGTYLSGFSTKSLGDARQIDNVSRFFSENAIAFKNLVVLSQIHSTNISIYQEANPTNSINKLIDTDGVITKKSGVVLVIRNADCVPLLFTDKSTGTIGLSHQGWRGSLKEMAPKMVNTFLSLGSKVENLTCSIGPAIGACCYDVDDDRYYSFLELFDGYSDKIFFNKKGRWHLNLALLNYLQLVKAGVKKENIDFFPFCTKCDSKRFFSRRRSGSANFAEMFNFVVKIR